MIQAGKLLTALALTLITSSIAHADRSDVICVQKALLDAGHDPNGVDGEIGPGTTSAAASYVSATGIALPDLSRQTAPIWCGYFNGEPLPVSDEVIAGPDADERVLALVRKALATSRSYVETRFEVDTPAIEAFVSGDAAWMTDHYLRVNELSEGYRSGKMREFGRCEPAAEAGLGVMFLCQSNNRWRNDTNAIHMTAHEYWHTAIQYHLVGQRCCRDSNAMSLFGPEWLVEGAAEYFATTVRQEMGIGSVAREMREYRRRIDPGIDLTELQSRRGFRENQGWDAGPLAVYLLVEETGFESLVTYYQAIGDGQAMEVAFQQAFGLSQEEFSEQFGAYLR